MNGAFAVGGTVGGGNVEISVLRVLLREGRPPVGGGPWVVDSVGTPIGGRDTGEFVVRLVDCVLVLGVLGATGVEGRCVFAVVVVCVFVPVVCCARTSPERRDTAKRTERRSERFSERRVELIVPVGIARGDGERVEEKFVPPKGGWDAVAGVPGRSSRRGMWG